jgi:hypothetical protein
MKVPELKKPLHYKVCQRSASSEMGKLGKISINAGF